MNFKLWLETNIGSVSRPLYHAHPDVNELKKNGFTKRDTNRSTGIASVVIQAPNYRESLGADGIHLSRSFDFCKDWATRYGPTGGVVEVFFHARRPFLVPAKATFGNKTSFRAFVNPEEKYLLPLTGDAKVDVDRIAQSVMHMETTKKLIQEEGHLWPLAEYLPRSIGGADLPIALQAKKMAQQLYGYGSFRLDEWPEVWSDLNPAFKEKPIAILNSETWKTWTDKGFVDSIWWESSGQGPFHGEDEVTVFDPRRLCVGAVIYRNTEEPIPRPRMKW